MSRHGFKLADLDGLPNVKFSGLVCRIQEKEGDLIRSQLIDEMDDLLMKF